MMTWIDKLEARLVVDTETGCRLWDGARSSAGYGQLRVGGKVQYVHRLVYEIEVGPISDGLELDHLCRVRHCANVSHLDLVTHKVNMSRSSTAARTHCPKGHAYDEENTRVCRDGARACRACHRESERARRARTRSAQ